MILGFGLAGLGHTYPLILVFWVTVLRNEYLLNELIITAEILGGKVEIEICEEKAWFLLLFV